MRPSSLLNQYAVAALCSLALLMPLSVTAQNGQQCIADFERTSWQSGFLCVLGIAEDSNIQADQDLGDFILSIIRVGLNLTGILALGFVIYAGVRYIMSRGDEGEVEKAKKTLLYTLIGLLIIGISIILVNLTIGAFQNNGAAGGQQGNQAPAGQGAGGGGGGAVNPPQLPLK